MRWGDDRMIECRTATLPELEQVLEWAGALGWNPGVDDAGAFFAADPSGFFVALDGDTPVAAISVVNHNDSFAFLGLYICIPSHRGQGIGMALWSHAIRHAGTRTIGLDAVAEQQANYSASGFAPAGPTTRFQGRIRAGASDAVRPVTGDDIPALIRTEALASGWHKPRYLTAWMTKAATRQSVILAKGKTRIAGFATVRDCGEGRKVGPFWADDAEAGLELLFHLAGMGAGDLVLDVPASSAGLAALCRKQGLECGFETTRMYRGPAPAAAHEFFAVTSLELG